MLMKNREKKKQKKITKTFDIFDKNDGTNAQLWLFMV